MLRSELGKKGGRHRRARQGYDQARGVEGPHLGERSPHVAPGGVVGKGWSTGRRRISGPRRDEHSPHELALSNLPRPFQEGRRQAAARRILLELIDTLPDAYRQAMRLRVLDDLSYAEVAENMNLPVKTVYTKIHKGKRALSHGLKERGLASTLRN